ncbi:putative HTH-type transcriptional regulator YfiR [Burkholderiales bacterium]|nr:putative HTH-type transcriptional regulator YfiR [Burkholderiales bacterium]
MARYPAEHKGETRARILAASDALMKDRGIEAASVDAVMRAAGLTVGGFYAHFASKEELASETLLHGLTRSFDRMVDRLDGATGGEWVRGMISAYLAQAEDPDLAHACPMTLLLADVARSEDTRKRRFADVTRAMLDRVVGHFPARGGLSPRETALATYATLVGAVALARTTPSRTSRRTIVASCERMLLAWLGLDGVAPPSEPPAAAPARGPGAGARTRRSRSRRAG